MKKIIFALIVLCFSVSAYAELDEVVLTMTGTGRTENDAVHQALRSAVEQTMGTFISSNTTMVNDRLTQDEIITVSSGNIKSYDIISKKQFQGECVVTVKAVVSLSKLTKYAKSHGSSCEFAGQTFAQNMKLRQLYKENEKKTIDNLFYQLSKMVPDLYDIRLNVSDPKVYGEGYLFPMTLQFVATDKFNEFFELFFLTLESLSMSDTECQSYKSNGEAYYEIKQKLTPEESSAKSESQMRANRYQYRNPYSHQSSYPSYAPSYDYGPYYLRNKFNLKRVQKIILGAMHCMVYQNNNRSENIVLSHSYDSYGYTLKAGEEVSYLWNRRFESRNQSYFTLKGYADPKDRITLGYEEYEYPIGTVMKITRKKGIIQSVDSYKSQFNFRCSFPFYVAKDKINQVTGFSVESLMK